MRISIVKGTQRVWSMSDEEISIKEMEAVRRKERQLGRKSTLHVHVEGGNKGDFVPPLTEVVDETKKEDLDNSTTSVNIESAVNEDANISDDVETEDDLAEVLEEDNYDKAESEENSIIEDEEFDTETADESDEDGEIENSEIDENPEPETYDESIVDEDSEEESDEESEEESKDDKKEFNVQSKFVEVESHPTDEDNIVSKTNSVIDDFFAKEAKEARMYGKRQPYQQKPRPRTNKKGNKIREY